MVNKYVTLQQYINSIGSFTPIYLCRYLEDVKEYNGKVLWHEDPSDIVKRMFFQYHYPCESFVVIAPSGAYISFLGEYPIEYVIDAIDALASTSINDEK